MFVCFSVRAQDDILRFTRKLTSVSLTTRTASSLEEVLIVSCTSLQMFYVILSKIMCLAVKRVPQFRLASAKVRTFVITAKCLRKKVWGNLNTNFP